MELLAKAILAVMKEVEGIDKAMAVGTGKSAYKGVSDESVKEAIGGAMQRHGLCILPIEVEPRTKVERWEVTDNYGTTMKQAVFTEVTTKYLLLHESGQSQVLSGYGHGTDSQDKGAGKATTYALKYLLLYTFLVPTRKIDDADKDHSDEKEVPKTNGTTLHNHKQLGTNEKPLITNLLFKKLCERIESGELGAYQKALDAFSFEATQKKRLETLFTEKNLQTV